MRFSKAEEYELSANAMFRDLFAKRLGSRHLRGYGRFAPGASLPCHTHLYDESITIVEGAATCLVAGRRYSLSGCDTALVPKGQPHRFINESDEPMAMVWVYAGDEPERVIVDNAICSGRGNKFPCISESLQLDAYAGSDTSGIADIRESSSRWRQEVGSRSS